MVLWNSRAHGKKSASTDAHTVRAFAWLAVRTCACESANASRSINDDTFTRTARSQAWRIPKGSHCTTSAGSRMAVSERRSRPRRYQWVYVRITNVHTAQTPLHRGLPAVSDRPRALLCWSVEPWRGDDHACHPFQINAQQTPIRDTCRIPYHTGGLRIRIPRSQVSWPCDHASGAQRQSPPL